jgi:hypothetical protein
MFVKLSIKTLTPVSEIIKIVYSKKELDSNARKKAKRAIGE